MKKLSQNISYFFVAFILILLSACTGKMDMAKYKLTKADSSKLNLTDYPAIRKEILALRGAKEAPTPCLDDVVAVGPEGSRSIGTEKWKEGFDKKGISFKKVVIIPGSEILRVYNEGKTVVLNYVVNVTFDTPIGDINLNVCRLETYINNNNQWCMVAGQGTEPIDYDDVFKTLALRILAAFLVGAIITYLIMRRKIKKHIIKS